MLTVNDDRCVVERQLADTGSGKTVAARAAIAALDQTRHTLIYLADPTTGTRGIHYQVASARRPARPRQRHPRHPGRRPARRRT